METESDPPRFSADQPLTNPVDDKLNRDRLSREIARSIANWSEKDSLVVSLIGEWGSGKSTIKNFVVYHLEGKAYVLQFNPWQWSGQDKLLQAFLWQVGALFGQKDIAKRTKRLASKWKAYASILKVGGVLSAPAQKLAAGLLALSAIGVVLSALFRAPLWVLIIAATLCLAFSIGFIARVAAGIATALSDWAAFQEKPVEELRAEIEQEMRKLERPVVIFIDDIDRLTDGEIKLLVQLVKANTQFPNLVFFLLFQKSIVTKALSSITSDDGAKYLSKIVQVEFAVPAASEKELQRILTEGLDQIITRDGVTIRWDDRRWPLLFLDTLWPYFNNLRDIKRFLGVFEFYFSMHLNQGTLEVNPIDLIAIEVLRMFDHDALLAISKSFYHDPDSFKRSLFKTEETSKRFQADIDAAVSASGRDEKSKSRLKDLLQALFPQSTGDRSENEWKRDLRICDELSFNKYFQVSVDTTKPSAYEVRRFLEVSGNRNELVTLLRQTIKNNTIEDFLDFIFVTKEEIPMDKMGTVSTAMFDVGDELPEPKPSLFRVGLDMQCNRIIFHRLKGEDPAKTTELLWRAFNDTTGFILPIHKLALEDRAVRQRGEKTDFVIDERRLGDFINLELGRIRARANDFSLLNHKECDYVLHLWKEWSHSDEVNEWIVRVISDPNRALKFLRRVISVSIINGVKRVPVLHGELLEKFVDLNKLHSVVTAVPLEKQTDEDRANILLLEKAIFRKSEGKPYSDVRTNSFDF